MQPPSANCSARPGRSAKPAPAAPVENRYGDAAGHACIAVSGPVERVITVETGDSDREANMWVFAARAFDLLQQCLSEAE